MAATMAPTRSGFSPSVPQTFDELGISQSLVMDLLLRRLLLEGFSNLQTLSSKLKLAVPILNIIFNHMRQQQLVEVKGMIGNDYHFHAVAIRQDTGGRTLSDHPVRGSSAGVAAGLPQRDQAAVGAGADRPRRPLRSAFSDLVVPRSLLDQLGPALISQNSIFVYGPTGNGKTSLAERMLRVYQDAVLLPYAVEVDGQIISLYDPVVHQPLEIEDPDIDPRWVLCRRPVHRGGRRTDPQHAGIAPGRSLRHLCRAAADEGQQRHLHHRRFRPPAHVAARSVEPLDRSAGPPRGLSDAALWREIPDSVRADGGVFHQPGTQRSGRRSVPAPHPQ